MTRKTLQRRKELHEALDELASDYLIDTKKLLSKTSLIELIYWSYQQIQEEQDWLKNEADQ